jgi:competence protein ComEA
MDSDDAVSARLWSVLPDSAPTPQRAAGSQSWKDLVTEEPGTWSSAPYAWTAAEQPAGDDPPPERADGPAAPLSGSGAFATSRFSVFDPGRRGARALAAVAVLVVVVAALLAWRSRPRVDAVAEPPAAVPAASGQAADQPSDGAAGARASGAAGVVVAVAGKVRRPGLVRLPAGSRVADAVQAAGGADAGVDVTMLNPARKVVDGELIVVGVPPPSGAVAAAAGTGPAAATAPGAPVNLNTATMAELDSLPGVGPVLAQRILDTRAAQGGFTAVSDLRKVDGIGDARYEQLKDLVVV